ncbi:gluconokinase [Streptomyces actuosus]|uniref:Gluconokinase n=2 Tax=Streptomyces actuosus TaxID=1885 RepID=A0ABS2VMN6_STRAS|nr:gluconokinase [Streptomyces actuosus]
MGVSGAGKSTVGSRLAHRLGVPFLEGDDLHPAANRTKMASGHPLDDADRRPWLASLAEWIRAAASSGRGGVVACSSLKHSYRDAFRRTGAEMRFVYLELTPEVAGERRAHRKGHFMPAQLLGSQYAALDPLDRDEPGVTVGASGTPEQVVSAALEAVLGPDG